MSQTLFIDSPDIVEISENFRDQPKVAGGGNRAKGNGNLNAIWYEWKKIDGKGCFASASPEIAARLIRASSARQLFERPAIKNSSNDEMYDTEIDPKRLVACFDLFCGELRYDDFDWAGCATGVILSLARIDPTDRIGEFVDLTDMATVVVTQFGITRQSKKINHSLDRRDALIVAAIGALRAVEALYADTIECGEFLSMNSIDMKRFREINQPLSIVNSFHLNTQMKDAGNSLVRREATLMEIESEMLCDLSGLVTKANWLCSQLYDSNPKLAATLERQILRKMAKELSIASREEL